MRFQRRGGRKRIVAPDGGEIVPTSKPQPDGTLVKALARAWRWQRMLDTGTYSCVSEIGDAENISKSYVSRILRLVLLAPDKTVSRRLTRLGRTSRAGTGEPKRLAKTQTAAAQRASALAWIAWRNGRTSFSASS